MSNAMSSWPSIKFLIGCFEWFMLWVVGLANLMTSKHHNAKLLFSFAQPPILTYPFLANIPIFYPLKTSEKFRFSGVFRGYKKGAFAKNGLKYLTCITFMLWIHALSFYVVSGFLPYLSYFCSASNTNRFNHAQSCLGIRSYQTHKTPTATQTVLLLVQTTAYQLQYQQTDLGYQINTSF